MSIYEDISANFGTKDDQYSYASPKYAQLLPIKIVWSTNHGPSIDFLLFSFVLMLKILPMRSRRNLQIKLLQLEEN